LKLIALPLDEQAKIELRPAKGVDVGEGKGNASTRSLKGGVVGLLLDGRGRPLQLPVDQQMRVSALSRWYKTVELYPK
jgi:hypothetical protein